MEKRYHRYDDWGQVTIVELSDYADQHLKFDQCVLPRMQRCIAQTLQGCNCKAVDLPWFAIQPTRISMITTTGM